MKSKSGMCEECWQRGIIETGSPDRPLEVHHKVPLTDQTLNIPAIAYGWDNLQLLCKDCHDKKKQKQAKRWEVDPDGRVHI